MLPKPESDERYNNNLFGQFKGFTITPIKSRPRSPEPNKPAPPPPTIPTVAIKTNIRTLPRSNPRNSILSSVSSFDSNTAPSSVAPGSLAPSAMAPALPPLNPGCTARPLISSPVLAATTCTSVELVAPKPCQPIKPSMDVPTRPAPAPPIAAELLKPQRPNSTPLTNVLLAEPEKKPEKSSTLNRIASMLRPSSGIMKTSLQLTPKEEKTNSLPRAQHHKANKVIDKEILRNLEISNPIPQKEIEIPTPAIPVVPEAEKKSVVLRAQSMRDSKLTPRPAIQTFGSMRQTTPLKRPTSIPASTRPTAPPPGPPTSSATEKDETGKIPGLPGYQNPQVKTQKVDNAYDDCMNLVSDSALTKIPEESPTSDNIYAVIEEAIPEKSRKNPEPEKLDNEYKLPKRVDANSAGLESMGLLSEIVSEISNRNFDSIYSSTTLRKKEEAAKKEELGSNSSLGAYVNSGHYKSPGSIYSNSASGKFNSSCSTTSSGYLNPSVLNVPRQEEKVDTKSTNLGTLSSTNPNINDEISKELGMKPAEDAPKPLTALKSRPLQQTSKSEDSNKETKPPLRTKTPPHLVKGSKDAVTRQLSETLRSKQCDSGPKVSKVSSAEGTAAGLSQSDKDKDRANVRLSLKTVPCSPKDSGGKFSSPDVVSSCSNQVGTKSPDVLGSNPKLSFQKSTQKTPTLSRGSPKTPTTPLKPLIASRATTLVEKKKSPTGNANKTLSTKETTSKTPQPKLAQKTEVKGDSGPKANPVQRAATGKSNVASLQQKFEANKNANAPRTVLSVHKKTVGKGTEPGAKK